MKKLICILICLTIPLVSFASSLSLEDKMQMQMNSGSGFKADYELTINLEGDKSQTLKGKLDTILENTIYQTRIFDDKENLLFSINSKNLNNFNLEHKNDVYSIINLKNKINLSQINFLNKYLKLPHTISTIVYILNYDREYNLDTVMLKKQRDEEVNYTLSTSLENLKTDIDTWLQSYIDNNKDNNIKYNSLKYKVPVEELKEFMKSTIVEISKNNYLIDALKDALPYEYSSTLLDFSNIEYIKLAIDSLPIDGDIIIEKLFTKDGKSHSSHIELPMYDEDNKSYNINITVMDDINEISNINIESENNTININYKKNEDENKIAYDGNIKISLDSENIISYDFIYNSSSEDSISEDDTRNLNTSKYIKFNNTSYQGNLEKIDDFEISITNSMNSAPSNKAKTNIYSEFSIKNLTKNEAIQLKINGATSAPWSLSSIKDATISYDAIAQSNEILDTIISLSSLEIIKESSFYNFIQTNLK